VGGVFCFYFLVFYLFVEVSVLGVSVPPEENTWVEVAPLQQARSNLGAAVVDGKIYAIGGQMLSYQDDGRIVTPEVATNEMYDPVANSWIYKAPMPISGSDFAVAVFKNKLYCIGGGVTWFFNFLRGERDVVLGEGFNLVYDPVLDVWENRTAMPIPQIGAQANVVDGKIYLLGGSPNGSLNLVYDPLTDSWVQGASVPEGFFLGFQLFMGIKFMLLALMLSQVIGIVMGSTLMVQ
jgi:N-acetylneuraminic acid mutarotase